MTVRRFLSKPVWLMPLLLAGIAGGVLALSIATHTHQASAVSGSDFNPGYIIDDGVFYNQSAMSTSAIQAFLTSQVPTCDTSGNQSVSYWYNASTGYLSLSTQQSGSSWVTTTRALYGSRYDTRTGRTDGAAPFICLKDYVGNTPQEEAASGYCSALPAASNQTAAQIIYNVAQACHINPQVLIVLVQKEQSLVTDDWPQGIEYEHATGFACPDNGGCNPSYAGFFDQVYSAARQFQIYKANPTNYNYVAGTTTTIYYNPNLSGCGSSQVYIQNQATAGLYDYTPYQPNAAALSNLYGSGDSCSSYGNRNFWRYFNDWFGSTIYYVQGGIGAYYNSINGPSVLGTPVQNEVYMGNNSWYQCFQNGCIIGTSDTGFWMSKGAIRTFWASIGYQTGIAGFPLESEQYDSTTKTYSQRYQNGTIYYSDTLGGRFVAAPLDAYWKSVGGFQSSLELPEYSTVGDLNTFAWQQYQNGYVVGNNTVGFFMSKGAIRTFWASIGYQTGKAGFPTSSEQYDAATKTYSQTYQYGTIYYSDALGGRFVRTEITNYWNSVGGGGGEMGVPIGSTAGNLNTFAWQQYQNGYVVGNYTTGFWMSKGAIRTYWASIGYQTGKAGFPIDSEQYDSATKTYSQRYQYGTIYYSDAAGGRFVKN